MTGGFSRAIHIVQSQFGWKDAEILALPICRLRQMVELISQEKTEELRVKARVIEWQTKHFGAFLVAVAQSAEQGKSLEKMVKKLKLPLDDEDTSDTRPIEQVIEEGALIDEADQPTFEQLSAALGGIGQVG